MLDSQDKIIKIIEILQSKFSQLGLYPVFGAELEFYLIEDKMTMPNNHYHISIEEGKNQYEVKFIHQQNLLNLATEINNFKKTYQDQANFSAKPYLDKPGSSLQINISIADSTGVNLFNHNSIMQNHWILFSINGLCKLMINSMLVFTPFKESFLRFQSDQKNTTKKVSWGINNRTVALRVTANQKHQRRIEHRLPGSDSCVYKVILYILAGIYHGICLKQNPPAAIWGDAFNEQYQAPILPLNLADAQKEFLNIAKLENLLILNVDKI